MSEEIEFAGTGAAPAEDDPTLGLGDVGIANLDSSNFQGVEEIGEVMPAGSKLKFNLRSYKQKTNKPWEGEFGKPEYEAYGEQPYVNIRFVCVQEPYVGKSIFLYAGLVNAKTSTCATQGDKTAQALCKRLKAIKSVMSGAEYKAHGQFDPKAFLDSQPDVGIELGVGTNQRSGKKENVITSFIPVSKLK